MICSICLFLWYKYTHHSQFQFINITICRVGKCTQLAVTNQYKPVWEGSRFTTQSLDSYSWHDREYLMSSSNSGIASKNLCELRQSLKLWHLTFLTSIELFVLDGVSDSLLLLFWVLFIVLRGRQGYSHFADEKLKLTDIKWFLSWCNNEDKK